jgi:hypothetical protein
MAPPPRKLVQALVALATTLLLLLLHPAPASGQSCTPSTCAFTRTLNNDPAVIMPCADFGLITGGAFVSTWNLNPPSICTNRYCGPNDGVYTQTILPSNCSDGYYGQITSGTCSFSMNCWYDLQFGSLRGTNLHNFGTRASVTTSVRNGQGHRGLCSTFPTQSSVYAGTFYAGFGTTNGNSANPTAASVVGSCLVCPAGAYCPVNTVSNPATTRPCPAGFYCPTGTGAIGGSKAPLQCPAGSACPAGASAPTTCGFATYSAAGASSCTPCGSGLGHFLTGQTSSASCGACGAGYYCPGTDSSPITACPVGTSSSATGASSSATCRPCAIGSYAGAVATTTCPLCPAGRYGDVTGLSSSACSGQCTAGYFCPAGSSSSTNMSCTTLGNSGFYCPAGTSAPLACSSPSVMTAPLAVASTNRYQCVPCGTNRACDQGAMLPPTDFGLTCPGGVVSLSLFAGANTTTIGQALLPRAPGWPSPTLNITLLPFASPDATCEAPAITYDSGTGFLRLGARPMPYCFSGYSGTLLVQRAGDTGTADAATPTSCTALITTQQTPLAPALNCSDIVVPEFTDPGLDLPVAITSRNRNVNTFLLHTFRQVTANPNPNSPSPLTMDACKGTLSTALTLTRAYATSYNVSVDVSNIGLAETMVSTCNFTVTVARINIPPALTATAFAVVDFSPVGTVIGNVRAADRNGDAVRGFAILTAVPGLPFAVDAQGNLTIAQSGVLNAYVTSVYTLVLNFTDGEACATGTVTISLIPAPRPPACTDVAIGVLDTTPVGALLAPRLPASHPQLTPFSFALAGNNNVDTFNVSAANGTLGLVAPLDFNNRSSYALPFSVTDSNGLSASCTATVTVLETNKAPDFGAAQLNLTVAEGSTSGSTVASVAATDANLWQTLRYAVRSCAPLINGSCPFALDPFTGRLTVAQLLTGSSLQFDPSLTYAAGPETFSLNISATDNGVPALTTTLSIALRVVLIGPRLTVSPVVLPRLVLAGYVVAHLGQPSFTYLPPSYNRSALVYSFDRLSATTTFEGQTAFVISPNGTVSVASPTPTWVYETRNAFPLTVLIVDESTGRQTTALLTVNLAHMNQPPRWTSSPVLFTPARFNGNIGPLLSTYVRDNDIGFPGVNEVLTFSLPGSPPANGNTDGTFRVSGAGQISTLDPNTPSFVFTTPAPTVYNLSILVCDAGIDGSSLCSTGYVALQVTQGNSAPAFASPSYALAIDENSPLGTVLLDATTGVGPAASDPDAGQSLTYTVVAGSGATGPFAVNPTTGAVYIASAVNFEARASYTFAVLATDSFAPPLTARANVSVTVNDLNEPAVFNGTGIRTPSGASAASLSVLENATFGTVVGRVVANDADAGASGQVIYSLLRDSQADAFAIDSTTGVLTLAAPLDWETQPVWTPTVLATDGSGAPVTAQLTVSVQVLDVNDVAVTSIVVSAADAGAGLGVVDPRSVYGDAFINMSALFSTTGVTAVLVGANLGFTPARLAAESLGSSPTTLTATFGPTGREFTATACAVQSSTQATCTVPAGVGADHIWVVTVATAAPGAVASCQATASVRTGYLPPSLAAVYVEGSASTTDPAQNAIPTDGGTPLLVTGTNFGPTGTLIRLVYGSAAASPTAYTATCVSVDPHISARCWSVAGVGGPLVFRLLVGSNAKGASDLFASSPVAYAVPTVSIVRAGLLNTAGGDAVVLTGNNYGPIGTAGIVALYSAGWTQAGVASTTTTYTTARCTVTIAHRQLTCLASPGIGASHAWVVSVAGRTGTAASADTTSYRLPAVSAVGGPGAFKAVTEGGQAVILTGTQFGPLTPLDPGTGLPLASAAADAPVVRYGRAASPSTPFASLSYLAETCAVTVADVQITCYTAPGSGADLVWAVSVGTQLSPLRLNLTSNYAAPVVAFYSGPGSREADTMGGEVVVISGRNFGPLSSPIDRVEYGINGTDLSFVATACAHSPTNPHSELTCATAPGVGAGLTWTVIVDGQRSTAPTTDYHPPVVDSAVILGSTAVPPVEARTDGGDVLVLSGRYFSTTPFLNSVVYGRGSASYRAANCSVTVPEVEIRCTTVPGTGRRLLVKVVVGGQEQEAPAAASAAAAPYVSYAAPVIQSVSPISGPTDGGIRVTLTGTDFGLAAPSSSFEVRLNADTPKPPPVPRPNAAAVANHFASLYDGGVGDDAVARWIATFDAAVPILPSFVPRVSSTVSFLLPEGYGPARELLLLVNGVPSNLVNFTYEAPVITNVAPDRVGVGPGQLRIFVEGTGFCAGPPSPCGTLLVGGASTSTLSWAHGRISAVVDDPGNGQATVVTVVVGGVQSNAVAFSTPVPTISSLSSQGNWGGGAVVLVDSATVSFAVAIQGPISAATLATVPVAGATRGAVARALDIAASSVVLTTLEDEDTGAVITLRGSDAPNTVQPARRLSGTGSPTGANVTMSINLVAALSATGVRVSEASVAALLANVTTSLGSASFAASLVGAIAAATSQPASAVAVQLDSTTAIAPLVQTRTLPSGASMSTRGGNLFYINDVISIASVAETDLAILIGGRPCTNLTRTWTGDLGQQYGIPSTSPIASDYYLFRLECLTPPGAGANLPIRISVPGGQSQADPAFTFTYAAPNITAVVDVADPSGTVYYAGYASVAGVPAPVQPMGMPTLGTDIVIVGEDFATPALLAAGPASFALSVLTTDALGVVSAATVLQHSHESIVARVRPGQGKNVRVTVVVGAQTDVDARAGGTVRAPTFVRYAVPSITAVYNPSTGGQGDPTRGGTMLTISGLNFGTAAGSASVAEGRPVVTIGEWNSPLAAGFAAFPGHGRIDAVLPAGWGGNLSVVVTVAGQSSSPAAYSYARPTVLAVTPTQGPTSGRTALTDEPISMTVLGTNFGLNVSIELRPSAAAVASGNPTAVVVRVPPSSVLSSNHTAVTFLMPEGAGAPLTVVAVAGSQESAETGVLFSYAPPTVSGIVSGDFAAAYCVPRLAQIAPGVNKTVYASYPGCFPTLAEPRITLRVTGESFGGPLLPMRITVGGRNCEVLSHSHTFALCVLPQGMGDAVPVVLSVGGFTGPPSTFSYDPPVITAVMPNAPPAVGGDRIEIRGHNFGPAPGTDLQITVGSLECRDPLWLNDGMLTCEVGADVVGPKNITILGANRSTASVWYEAENLVHLRCPSGWYGMRGEVCVECGSTGADQTAGAKCPGGELDRDLVVSLPGFWRSNVRDVALCHPLRQHRALKADTYPGCPVFLACSPASSCLGANKCGAEYRGDRCMTCAPQYYRVNDECVKCPDSPWAVLIIFCVIAALALGLAYTLNAYSVNLALISIGMDWAQVVAVFARARIRWPALVKQIFLILSAFNFNLELIAPECAVPEVTFAGKWLFIEGLPIFGWTLLFLLFVSRLVWKSICLGRPKNKLFTHLPVLVATGIVVQRVLYLYTTRTTLDIFNCSPATPPDYDKDGNVINYMAYNLSIVCNEPGGTHIFLIPFAVAALAIYVVGLPCLSLWHLAKNREKVKVDQMLRAMTAGDNRLTNPFFSFRKTWKALYMNYVPEAWYWDFIVVVRKFLIAFCSLMFRATPSFQLAMALLVLFVCFVLQVRFNPYLSHSEAERTVRDHRRLVLEGDAAHVRMHEILRSRALHNSRPASVSQNLSKLDKQRGGKGGRLDDGSLSPSAGGGAGSSSSSILLSVGPVSSNGGVGADIDSFISRNRSAFQRAVHNGRPVILAHPVTRVLFDYNTAEATLLASAILINLAGISFDSSRFSDENLKLPGIVAQYDSLATVTLLIMFVTIVYWFLALALDLASITSPVCTATCLARLSSAGEAGFRRAARTLRKGGELGARGRKGSEGSMSSGGSSSPSALSPGGADVNMVNMTTNPTLALAVASGGRAVDNTEALEEAMADMVAPPDATTWKLIRSSFLSMNGRLRLLAQENETLRSRAEEGAEELAAGGKAAGGARKVKSQFQPTSAATAGTGSAGAGSSAMSLRGMKSFRSTAAAAGKKSSQGAAAAGAADEGAN